MKILITGGEGILATSLLTTLNGKFDAVKKSRTEMDITDLNTVKKVFLHENPDLVIHTAASTNVEECEKNPTQAQKINLEGTKNIVDIANSVSCKVIYISSTGVYGKTLETPYLESDKVEPTTVHHMTKWQGECYCLEKSIDALVIRTGWIFGGGTEHKKNFVWNRIKEAQQVDFIYGDPRQRGNPTYALDLSQQIKLMIEKKLSGVFNVCGIGSASRIEYVREILKSFEVETEVKEAPLGFFKRQASVSMNESAENQKLDQMNLNIMKPWRESLQSYVQILKKEVSECH